MKEPSTKENTLYLPIKQIYFDQIIALTKKEEYREIKEGITANRYLIKDQITKYKINTEVADVSKEYFIDDYNKGHFPFIPKPYKYLNIVVGYAKERDTAIVEVLDYSFLPSMIRAELYAFWQIVYHLGKVVQLNRRAK